MYWMWYLQGLIVWARFQINPYGVLWADWEFGGNPSIPEHFSLSYWRVHEVSSEYTTTLLHNSIVSYLHLKFMYQYLDESVKNYFLKSYCIYMCTMLYILNLSSFERFGTIMIFDYVLMAD